MIYTQNVNRNGMVSLALRCECHDWDHRLEFTWDEEDGLGYISAHLVMLPWRRRFWLGIKYILGIDCPPWVETTFSAEDAGEIAKWMQRRAK